MFFEFVIRMVLRIDETSKSLAKTLSEVAELDTTGILDEFDLKPPDRRESPADQMKLHRQFFLEIILVRHVENYLNYLSGLLYEIFVARPETLKSKETVDLETVLSHSSMQELVMELAQKKVDALSYSSFQSLSEYFSEKFSLRLFPEPETALIVDAIETRNISVHNLCVVNERYIQRTGSSTHPIGTKRVVLLDDIGSLVPLLGWGVKTLDKASRAKLGIKGSRFNTSKILSEELEAIRSRRLASE